MKYLQKLKVSNRLFLSNILYGIGFVVMLVRDGQRYEASVINVIQPQA